MKLRKDKLFKFFSLPKFFRVTEWDETYITSSTEEMSAKLYENKSLAAKEKVLQRDKAVCVHATKA